QDFGENNNLFLGYRLRMNFDTSFTGEDLLRTRFQARDIPGFATGEATALPNGLFRDHSGLAFEGDSDDDIVLDDLFYQFPLGPATVMVGVNSVGISDIVTDVSPFSSSGSGAVGFFGYNPIYDLGSQGIALGATFDITDEFQFGLGYLTDDDDGPDPSPGNGLFNGDNTYFGQLTFDSGDLVVALTYVNAYVNNSDIGEPGGEVGIFDATVYNSYGLSANFVLGDRFQIGGWINYTDGRAFNGDDPVIGDGRYWSYAATLGVSDLGVDGSLLGLIAGVPPFVAIYDFANGGAFGSDASLYVEGFYRVPISDNISITPSIIFVDDVNNENNNDGIVIGALRTTFRF
ncbi:MAG: iron uptake porin, partial [Cyanobacteria bacterium J06638_20]